MRLLIGLWLLAAWLPVLADNSSVPAEFVGEWVPSNGSCQAKSRLRVESQAVVLVNGSDSQKFGNLDLCYSCEGGARYSGSVVWLVPEFNTGAPASFTVRFNANEEIGATVIEMEREDLKKRFPLHNVKLRKCQNKT